MERRDFLKLFGLGVLTAPIAVKAVSAPQPVAKEYGYENFCTDLDKMFEYPGKGFPTGHTTMRAILAEEEFKNRRLSRLV